MFLLRHCRLVTADLDEAREHVGRLWERHRSYLPTSRGYGLRWHQVDLRNVSLSYMQGAAPIRLTCGPVGNVCRLSMPEEGAVEHRIRGHVARATPVSGVAYSSAQELELDIEPFRSLLLSFQGEFVWRLMRHRFGNENRTALCPTSIPFDFAPASALRSLCRWAGRELDRPGTPFLSSPRVISSFERTLLGLYLDCLEGQASFVVHPTKDLATTQLKQIESWLDAHFAEPIGVEDMAEVAGISVRTVQLGFRRLRGHTPRQAIISRRLQGAYDILQTGRPGLSVAAAAEACGFFHLGRFANHYLKAFGERPSETLANAWRRSA